MAIDRRCFLKGASAFAFSSGLIGCSSNSDNDDDNGGNQPEFDYTRHVTCPRNCGDRCSLLVTTEDGVATAITGDERHPVTGSAPCVKGHAYLQYIYSPDRLQQPLKRVGPRGPGARFEPVSWDEALNAIASNLNKIIEEHGGNAISYYKYSGNGGLSAAASGYRFFNRIASRRLEENICASAGYHGMTSILGEYIGPSPEDYVNTQCYVSWGTNEQATNIHHIKFINQARDKGAKVLVVNSARTPMASQADIWLQPTPGTDAMLALGICKVLIEDNLHDTDFISKYTQDFDALQERVDQFSHGQIAEHTGVSTSEYRAFAHAYAGVDAAMIRIGYGLQRTRNGGRIVRAIPMLAALTGNFGRPGAGVIYLNGQGNARNGGAANGGHLTPEGAKRDTISINEFARGLVAADYQQPDGTVGPMAYGESSELIKAFVCWNSNPMAVAPNTTLLEQGLMRDDLFTVGLELFMTDTMEYMDYVLPATSFIEQEDTCSSYHAYYTQHTHKQIEPLYQSRPNLEIFSALAKKMGFSDPEFSETIEQVNRNAWAGDISYDEFKQQGFYTPPNIEYPWRASLTWPTPSGKIEFKDTSGSYFDPEQFHPVIDVGTPESDTRQNYGLTEGEKLREFRLLSPAHAKMNNSQWANIKYTRNLPAHTLYIHPQDAAAKGIQTGDSVVLTATRHNNEEASIRYSAKVEPMTPAGTLFVWKCAWKKTNPNGSGTAINMITNCDLTDMNHGSSFHATRVDISLA
ncbi:molybdopterin-containing oxidoreductase family protein [Ferrimonas marina]|uniref:Anaerobic selenocysteine-containing dehydrogenase n=1 Tax=Ferrimonas marina TaxID=299255 RepID=A0A1M5XU69_9GAMM|nr:molybdopterin-dependent oxidoreductase [Ferrimonas marina]SHI03375.1 Anaerobic selenocysteine-containing dehydrogenase [Ferrimonas marina]